MRNKKPTARFKVGDRVRCQHVIYPYLRGTIVEDRGLPATTAVAITWSALTQIRSSPTFAWSRKTKSSST